VLVFDSGVGGLSVYNEIRQLLPNLHYIYAFDNVAFPMARRARSLSLSALWKSSLLSSSVIPWRWR
jgi:glutamate racemase